MGRREEEKGTGSQRSTGRERRGERTCISMRLDPSLLSSLDDFSF